MSIVAWMNKKGGVGKSSLSIQYSHWLHERAGAARVAVIELDDQRNTSRALTAFDSGVSAEQLLTAPAMAPERLAQCARVDRPLAVFGATAGMPDLDRSEPGPLFVAFATNVAHLAAHFDHVVIDTPPAVGLRMHAALIAAQYFSIQGMVEMLALVRSTKLQYNERLELAGVVANRFNPHSVRQRRGLEQLITHYHKHVIPRHISTRTAIPEAISEGVSVWKLAKSSAASARAELDGVFGCMAERMGMVLAPPVAGPAPAAPAPAAPAAA